MQNFQFKEYLLVLLGIVVIFFTVFFIYNEQTGEEHRNDAHNNLSYGYNLYKYGVMSHHHEVIRPTMFRDMLPGVFLSIWMRISTAISKDTEFDSVVEGTLAKHVRRINIIYSVFTLVSVWLLCFRLNSSQVLSVLSVVLTALFFILSKHNYNSLYSELLASFLLLISSYFLLLLISSANYYLLLSVLSGLCLGLLSLTKAALFYVTIVLLPILMLFLWNSFHQLSRAKKCTLLSLFLIAFLTLPVAWMNRNLQCCKRFALSGKGTSVLWSRAYRNISLTKEELYGAWYVYSPPEARKLLEDYTDFSSKDTNSGGRLQRLNREANRKSDVKILSSSDPDVENIIGLIWRAAGERKVLHKKNSDQQLEKKAIKLIVYNFHRHIYTTLLFGFRGIWSFNWNHEIASFPGVRFLVFIFNALSFLAFYFLALFSFFFGRKDIFIVLIIPFGMFNFYAFFTHFLPRYSMPLVPVMVISFLTLCSVIFHGNRARSNENCSNAEK